MVLLLFYLFLALFVSFLCSVMEAVLLSTPHSFLFVQKQQGKAWAKHFASLKSNIDKPLSAILSLNTVAHTVGAAGVGAQATKLWGEAAFGIVSAVLTVLILVITEIIPKTMGARYWRKLARPSAHIMRTMIFLTYPLVILAAMLTRLLSGSKKEKTTSREEIAALASIGASEGLFAPNEHKIIQNLLKLQKVRAAEIMTPRVVVTIAEENLTLHEFLKNKNYLQFSRIPVYSGNEENITGYVFRKEALEQLAKDQHEVQLRSIKHPILVVPENIALFSLWEKLLEQKEHIAMLVDEYGGFEGIVTMEDIIETLLGLEIVDETDTVTDMQQLARERWKEKQAKFRILLPDAPEQDEPQNQPQ